MRTIPILLTLRTSSRCTRLAPKVPVFHLGAALLALIISGAAHWWLRRGANPDTPATAVEGAYLRGGPRLARYACLAELLRLRMVRI